MMMAMTDDKCINHLPITADCGLAPHFLAAHKRPTRASRRLISSRPATLTSGDKAEAVIGTILGVEAIY